MTETSRAPLTARRAAAASFIGTTIEYYDFFLYGTAAAIVFAPQFFPAFSPVAGALASFGVFAAGFFARPLGGVVIGHLGDRVGRKSMLVLSLLMVGLSTMCIGLLPTYEQVGVWAPIGLVTLRLIQGFGVGGEWSGAVLLSVEHAPKNRRALFGVFPQTGVPAGLVLSTLAFLATSAFASEAFTAWAWRIPFLASVVLVALGMVVRLRVAESPEFVAVGRRGERSKRPLLDVLRAHPRQILVSGMLPAATVMITYIFTVYTLSYLTNQLQVSRPAALSCVLVGTVVFAVGLPLSGVLADRVGTRKVFLAGATWLLASAAVLFPLLETRNTGLSMLAAVLLCAGLAFSFGPVAAMISDLFPARLRFSGSSLGYQLATLAAGAPAPFVATAVYNATGGSSGVTLYMVLVAAISLVGGLVVSRVQLADVAPSVRETADPEPV